MWDSTAELKRIILEVDRLRMVAFGTGVPSGNVVPKFYFSFCGRTGRLNSPALVAHSLRVGRR